MQPRLTLLVPAGLMALLFACTSQEVQENDRQLPIGEHLTVRETVASIVDRMANALEPENLGTLTPQDVVHFLKDQERHILGAEHITFRVSVPVDVYLVGQAGFGSHLFWMQEQGFELTGLRAKMDGRDCEVWRKPFDAGPIGLGVPSLTGGGIHYVVALKPQQEGDTLEVTDLYPGAMTLGTYQVGERPWIDWEDLVDECDPELVGLTMIRTVGDDRNAARLIGLFKVTEYVATDTPDQIILTWSEDPKTTQTIQWRTSAGVGRGAVLYQKKADANRFEPRAPMRAGAMTAPMKSRYILNDPVCHRHTVTLRDLEPDTTYVYAVGDGSEEGWGELHQFTTAPDKVEPFSFIYMGDAQNGLDRWGSLLRNAILKRPDVRYVMMAGDLVNRGSDRDDWDVFFHNAAGVYENYQLIPAIGNHENQGGNPRMYLEMFDLPDNGPDGLEKERAYSLEYSNALMVVLDSNLDAAGQASWLDTQLANSDATWKFVMFHHPIYSSTPHRDNPTIRRHWVPLFDKHHVDLVLQGHDHAYLRTYPMKNNQRVETPAQGTIYVVSVSGTKMYEQDPRHYTEFGITKTSTYQVIDLQISGDRLLYRAYDIDGRPIDEFEIQK